jgi:hypothetical protein
MIMIIINNISYENIVFNNNNNNKCVMLDGYAGEEKKKIIYIKRSRERDAR